MNLHKFLHYGFSRLTMQKHVQRGLLPFGQDLQPKRWVFVIGCYNSATTLLASVLRKHPQIGGLFNEGTFLTDVLPYPEQFGWPRMWSKCYDKMIIESESDQSDRAKRIKRQWSIWYPKERDILVEKSVSNITRTLFLQKYFSPAYFIYIVRNGYVVSKGIQKKANYKRWNSPYRESEYPIDMCAEQWRVSDELIERDSKKLENILTVKYEDFVSNTSGTLNSITDFLEIEPMALDILESKFDIDEKHSKILDMNSEGLKRLSSEDFDIVDSVAGDTLSKFGYER